MGLDMYLTKKVYIGADYEHNDVKGKIELTSNGKPIAINMNQVTEIIEKVGQWRKANQIHNWFVDNVQNGEDDCKEYHVSFSELVNLRDLCMKALESKDASLLPPVAGFFFGSTEVDEWYWGELMATIEMINKLDNRSDYYYRSSW